jgi:AcrR family transcriptional regulator
MNSAIDSVLEKLRELFEQEYQRGQQDALRRVVDVMKEPDGRRPGRPGRPAGACKGRKAGGRIRARRGSARAFIERVLTQEKGGATVPQIMSAAGSPDEKAVSISAIRFELYRGKKEKRYRNVKGRWSLPGRAAKQ